MKRCPICNQLYNDDLLSFCLNEGASLVKQQTVFCVRCGATNSATANRCVDCNEILPGYQSTNFLKLVKSKLRRTVEHHVPSDRVTFICYAREDESFVRELVSLLKERGVRVWFDQFEINPGEDWDQKIDDALYGCSHFLIILSPAAIESREVAANYEQLWTKKNELYRSCLKPAVSLDN